MDGKSSWWLLSGGILAALALAGQYALVKPWTWNLDQISFVFLVGAILAAFAAWGLRWFMLGTAGVKARYRVFDRGMTAEFNNGAKMRRNLLFWIIFALLLVIVFHYANP